MTDLRETARELVAEALTGLGAQPSDWVDEASAQAIDALAPVFEVVEATRVLLDIMSKSAIWFGSEENAARHALDKLTEADA